MKIKIVLTNQDERLETIVDILNGIQNKIEFYLVRMEDYENQDDIIEWKDFLKKHGCCKDKTIYITEKRISDNWFSYNNDKIALISYNDWNLEFGFTSIKYYLVYQIVIALIAFVLEYKENEFEKISHKPSKGCVLDFCNEKSEIALGMKTGLLCGECKDRLKRFVSYEVIEAIESILGYVRGAFTDSSSINVKKAFVVMEFNEKNDVFYNNAIAPALKEMGLSPSRADLKTIDNIIYNNVMKQIELSNYVIVVASDNKNVYLELGYALACRKRVVLLKNKKLTNDIASDLSGMIYIGFDNEYDLKAKLIDKLNEMFVL